jgi:hypothetical protein
MPHKVEVSARGIAAYKLERKDPGPILDSMDEESRISAITFAEPGVRWCIR